MKTTFSSHSMVAHVWAQQRQEHGKGKNMFFEGRTIYSWGKHWVLAFFIDPSCSKFIQVIGGNVILNSESRSVSTRQHLGKVRNALQGSSHHVVSISSDNCIDRLHRANGDDDMMIEQYAQYCQEEYERWATAYQRVSERYQHNYKKAPKQFATVASNMLQFAYEYNRVIMSTEEGVVRLRYNDIQLCPISAAEMLRMKVIHDTIISYIDERTIKAEAAKHEQARIREEERVAKLETLKPYMDEAIITWRRGGERQANDTIREAIRAFVHDSPITRICCLNKDNIRTSRGADVPLDHAKLLIRAVQREIRTWRCLGVMSRPVQIRPVQVISVGSFSLNHINMAREEIRIGCHCLTFDEINRFVAYASEHLDIGVDASYMLS